jgi:hypothetical protein
MSLLSKSVVLLLGLACVVAADDKKFIVGAASSYPNRQTIESVTVAADAFETDAKTRPVFGKNNPYKHGVLPVLVVIQNGTSKVIDLRDLEATYIAPDRRNIEATPADEVQYVYGNRQRRVAQNPIPGGAPRVRGKNPLESFEIGSRAFVAKMLPPGESAHGFFYFQAGHRDGSKLLLKGMREAGTGRELFFFEIGLPDVAR